MSSIRNANRTTETKFYALLDAAKFRGGKDYPRRIDFLGTFSDGTRYMVEYGTRDLEFYLVTDLKAPAKASSTHSHLGLLAGSQTNLGFSTQSVAYVDILTPFTVTVPSNLPANTVLQFLCLAAVQCNETIGGDTFDFQLGDSTAGSFNSFGGFNHTTISVDGLLTNINEFNPAAGAHSFTVQGRVNLAANQLNVQYVQAAVYGWITQGPLSGT
jgi:hypothetical protein